MIYYLLWCCWSLGKLMLCILPTLWVTPSLQMLTGCIWQRVSRIRVWLWRLSGVKGGQWMYIIPCFPAMRTGTLPAGRLVALFISAAAHAALSFQREGQWSPAWKNAPSLPELNHQLCFSLCQLNRTRNFTLQTHGSVPPLILFLYIYCPSLEGFHSQVLQCVLVPQLWPNPSPPTGSLASVQLHMDRNCFVAESPRIDWNSESATTLARYSYLRPHPFLCF